MHADVRDGFFPGERAAADVGLTRIGELHAAAIALGKERPTNRLTKRLRIAAVLDHALGREERVDAARAGWARFVEDGLFADAISADLKRRDTLTYDCSAVASARDAAFALGDRGDRGLYGLESASGVWLKRSVVSVLPYTDGS